MYHVRTIRDQKATIKKGQLPKIHDLSHNIISNNHSKYTILVKIKIKLPIATAAIQKPLSSIFVPGYLYTKKLLRLLKGFCLSGS